MVLPTRSTENALAYRLPLSRTRLRQTSSAPINGSGILRPVRSDSTTIRQMRFEVLQNADLKLGHKALVLVLVPIIFEVLFVATFAGLLVQSQAETKREREARTILKHHQFMTTHLLLTGVFITKYELGGFHEKYLKRYEKTLNGINTEYTILERLVENNPLVLRNLKEFKVSLNGALEQLQEFRRLNESGQQLAALNNLAKLQTILPLLVERSATVVEHYDRIAKVSPLAQERVQDLMTFELIGGMILSVLLALWLARFFHATTVVRLDTLVDNILRLQTGKPLRPCLTGADEITDLDKTFHLLAEAITKSTDELMSSESRLRSVIEQMPTGLITLTDEATIETVNPQANAIFASRSEDLCGKPFGKLLSEDAGNIESSLEIMNRASEKTRLMKCKRVSGEELPIELTITDFTRDDHRGYLAHVQDVTERHEVERLKREFVAMISHDVRTPLASIKLTLELFAFGAYGSLSDEGVQRLLADERSCTNLMGLINNLLELENLESGKIVWEKRLVDLVHVIQLAAESVAMVARESRVTIDVDDITIQVLVDETRLLQVFTNLLSNAIKFSPPMSTVQVKAHETEEWVEIEFIDQGQGIPHSHHELIFDYFRQVEDSSRDRGFGLGLAICKLILAEHGGAIDVESEEGIGSTFLVRIPRKQSAGS